MTHLPAAALLFVLFIALVIVAAGIAARDEGKYSEREK